MSIDDTLAEAEAARAAEAEAAAHAAEAAADRGDKSAATVVPDPAAPSIAADETPLRDDKGRFIPKARFDEAVQRERSGRETAERALADLRAQMATVDKNADIEQLETEIVTLEQQHAQAIIDGDAQKAADLMGQIRIKERSISLTQSEDMSATARAQAAEDVRFDMAVKALEETYPVLDPNDDTYDHDIVTMIIGAQRQIIAEQRKAPSAALVDAARLVMAKLMPAGSDGAAKPGLAGAATGAGKEAARVAKNVAAASKQPPSMGSAGRDSTAAGVTGDAKIDVMSLSSEELAALPPAVVARLRGDAL